MQLKHEWLCQFDKLTRQEAAEEIKKYDEDLGYQ